MLKKIAWVVFIFSFLANLVFFLHLLAPEFYEDYFSIVEGICILISLACICLLIIAITYNAFAKKKFLSLHISLLFISNIVLQPTFFILMVAIEFNEDDTIYPNPCIGHFDEVNFEKRMRGKWPNVHCFTTTMDFNAKREDNSGIDCGKVHMYIAFDNNNLIVKDSFALTIAREYFNDTSNAEVKSLNIFMQSDNYYKTYLGNQYLGFSNDIKTTYNIDRVLANSNFNYNQRKDTTRTTYKIVKEYPVKERNKIVSITLSNENDIDKIKEELVNKYFQSGQDSIDKLNLNVYINNKSCTLCSSDDYEFFIQKLNTITSE